MDEKISLMLEKIGKHLDRKFNAQDNHYANTIATYWESFAWIHFIFVNYKFDKDDEWFLEILMNLLIKHGKINYNIASPMHSLCYLHNFSERFLKKYRNILYWDAIFTHNKLSFRIAWLMRHKVTGSVEYLISNNQNLSREFKNRFIRMLAKEREMNDGL